MEKPEVIVKSDAKDDNLVNVIVNVPKGYSMLLKSEVHQC